MAIDITIKMIYNLKNNIEAQQATERLNWLINKGKKAEIKERRKARSLSQNAYQHVLFDYYAMHTGYTASQVKQDIYKRYICQDIFVSVDNDINICRSTADLNTKETSICLDRFIDRALIDVGLKLPQPHENEFLEWCKEETDKYNNRGYL